MKIKLWLTVLRPAPDWNTINFDAPSELYWHEIETGALPGDGDHVVLYPPDDPSDSDHGGPYVFVRRRYLGPNGTWHVELQRIVVDAPEPIREQLMTYAARGHYEWTHWWTNTDPDPVPSLLEAGWLPYRGDENA
jgi:hypothetical protein